VEAHHQAPYLRAHVADEEVLAEELGVLLSVRLRDQDVGAAGDELAGAVGGGEDQWVHAPLLQLLLPQISPSLLQQGLDPMMPEVRIQLANVAWPQRCAQEALEDQAGHGDRARASVHERET